MNDDKRGRIDALLSAIPELTAGQLHWVQRAVSVYAAAHTFILNKSDLFGEITLQNSGDAMRIHHGFSGAPFSKDKFEYVFVNVLKLSGHNAQ